MGEFKAGTWIILLSVYFFCFFLIVYTVTNAANEFNVDHGIFYTDPGFQSLDPQSTVNNITGIVDPVSSHSWEAVLNTVSIMTGFNADIGIPNVVRFIYSFFLFWIPFLMLLWAIYMAIPFIH